MICRAWGAGVLGVYACGEVCIPAHDTPSGGLATVSCAKIVLISLVFSMWTLLLRLQSMQVDDFGWANVGWHRPGGDPEVVTPNMDALVKAGIELNRTYAFKFCSPTRSSLQSGRLPTHGAIRCLGCVDVHTGVWNMIELCLW